MTTTREPVTDVRDGIVVDAEDVANEEEEGGLIDREEKFEGCV